MASLGSVYHLWHDLQFIKLICFYRSINIRFMCNPIIKIKEMWPSLQLRVKRITNP